MAIKPILFNTEMVRAILDGRKTCTRRVIKLPKNMSGRPVGKSGDIGFMYLGGIKRPPYQQGDILYVRETWCKGSWMNEKERYYYKADDNDFHCVWHPSIHMPKEAARIWLRVTDVRVEWLQDITFDSCQNEGIYDDYKTYSETYTNNLRRVAYPKAFARLWDSTIKKSDLDRYGWDANPWVWVIDFERCEKPKEEE